ncbi:MAG: cell envelope integrity protein TolA [Chlorobiaceae bacterium]|nr:cell envelope integrity protein TolA [Chlorobiaceae bacterium]
MKKAQSHPAEKKFFRWLVVAAGMHVGLFVFALYLQRWDAERHAKPPKIVSVSLVSLPGSGGPSGFSEEPAGEASTIPASLPETAALSQAQPEAVQPMQQKMLVPPPATPKSISVAQTKPVDKQEQINKALERLKQVVAKNAPAPSKPSPAGGMGNLNKALAQLEQRVKAQGYPGGGGQASGSGRGDGGSGRGGGGPYKAVIASIIQQNWEFSRQMLKSSYGMEVYVRIHILADGTIQQILFDRRAPSEYLNNSVKKALERSSLPAIPKDERASELWVGFVFTPEGIEK